MCEEIKCEEIKCDTTEDYINAIELIVKQRQFASINGVVVDMQTANAIKTVYNACNLPQKDMLFSKGIVAASTLAWRAVK